MTSVYIYISYIYLKHAHTSYIVDLVVREHIIVMLHLVIWLQGRSNCVYKDAHSTSSILTPRLSLGFPQLGRYPTCSSQTIPPFALEDHHSRHVVDAMAAPDLRPPRGSDICMVRRHRLNSSLLPCAARRCTKRPGRVQLADLIVTAIVKMLMFDLGKLTLQSRGFWRHVRQFWHGMRIRVSSFDLSWARAFEVTDAIPYIIVKLPLQEKVTEMQKMVQTRLWT